MSNKNNRNGNGGPGWAIVFLLVGLAVAAMVLADLDLDFSDMINVTAAQSQTAVQSDTMAIYELRQTINEMDERLTKAMSGAGAKGDTAVPDALPTRIPISDREGLKVDNVKELIREIGIGSTGRSK